MKKISFVLLVALCFILFSFDKTEGVFYRKEHYQKELWYPIMINKLTEQDRADVHSAHWIQMLSSNYKISSEKSMPKLIEMLGKVIENEIRVFFRESEKDPQLYIFVETTYGILDLFTFNINTAELKRVNNKGFMVMHFGDRLSLKENTKEGILFYDDYEVESPKRFFRNQIYFNRAENSLMQIKSCEFINGVEQCKEAK